MNFKAQKNNYLKLFLDNYIKGLFGEDKKEFFRKLNNHTTTDSRQDFLFDVLNEKLPLEDKIGFELLGQIEDRNLDALEVARFDFELLPNGYDSKTNIVINKNNAGNVKVISITYLGGAKDYYSIDFINQQDELIKNINRVFFDELVHYIIEATQIELQQPQWNYDEIIQITDFNGNPI